jgi:hypothetical protein
MNGVITRYIRGLQPGEPLVNAAPDFILVVGGPRLLDKIGDQAQHFTLRHELLSHTSSLPQSLSPRSKAGFAPSFDRFAFWSQALFPPGWITRSAPILGLDIAD